MTYESGRREFLVGASGAVLSAGLVSGGGAAVQTTDDHAVGDGRTGSGTIVETDDGDLVHVRPGEEPPDGTTRGSVTTASDGDLRIAAAIVPVGPSFPDDGTADIWVGAFHDGEGAPEPAENEPLTVTVTPPDGEPESFDVETGEEGNHRLEYDLSEPGRESGRYGVAVDHDAVSGSTDAHFDVGTALDVTTSTRHPAALEKELTVSALARNGEHPESGVDVDFSVTDPDGATLVETAETTDQDGFATVSFTPAQTGSYSVGAEAAGTAAGSTGSTLNVVDVAAASSLLFRHAIPGEENVYGGYLTDGDELVGNATLTLRFLERFEEELVLEEQVTSDEFGFFLLEFDLPTDVEDDLDIEAELDDGREVMLSVDRIRVNEFDEEDDDEPDGVSLDASLSSWQYSPGTDADVEIEAEDGGDPIANVDVDVVIGYEWDGPPAASTTVTTGEDGTATATVPIPETAPDGVRLDGEASISYDDETYTDGLSAGVERYDIRFNTDAVPGDTSEFSVDVTDGETEDAVEGIPLAYDAQYGYSNVGSFDRGTLVSGADGTDDSAVSIPSDVQFLEYANYRHRYQERVYRWVIPEYPGELSIQQESIQPGETIDLDVTTPDGSSAQGIVFGDVGSPRKSIATTVSSEESASLTVPDHAAGDWLDLFLWATDEDGNLYSDRAFEGVEDDPETRADFTVTPADPTPEEPVTFDASGSTAETPPLSYDWDLGDGTTEEGAQVEHAYEDAGEYEVTLTVTDADGAVDTATETVDVEAPDDTPPDQHESGVDQDVFDAVDQTGDGDVSLGELQDAVADWSEDQQVDGVDTSLRDLRAIVDWWAS